MQNDVNDEIRIVQTDTENQNGQSKCPKCGSTDIAVNTTTGLLRCTFCRYEEAGKKVSNLETDLSNLHGQILASGTKDIVADTKDVMTFKCSSCGSEVVIDTASSTQARCHWCRNTLSVNEQISNGAIPDVVLPFKLSKEEAQIIIKDFVEKRKFFANPTFTKEFTTENIMGVYFPYMVVDVNSHVDLQGQGEKLIRTYTCGSGNNQTTYYDAELYNVERNFDLIIDGLTIESNSDRLNKHSNKTNNVINTIMPFDIENSVKYDANYLKGYTSERRDTNVDELRPIVEIQSKDIARHAANESLSEYNRGVAWASENLEIKGQQWKSAYLPVWLYSYQEVKGTQKTLHYVAVNARTKEVMGSIPIHMPKLFIISSLIELVGFYLMIKIDFDYSFIFLSVGIVYFLFMYNKYRNKSARHKHESETKTTIDNMRKVDNFVMMRKGLTNHKIEGVNNNKVTGESLENKLLGVITENSQVASIINKINKDD